MEADKKATTGSFIQNKNKKSFAFLQFASLKISGNEFKTNDTA